MTLATSPELTREERARISDIAGTLETLRNELHRRVVGQESVVTQMFAALLAEGHCLMVGVPGLAKTLLISTLAELLSLQFKRIQFTPDLMPSDITGSTVIRQNENGARDFHFMRGPIFANLILADEINRTPPKTQSALMEAMEEQQVSAGGKQLKLSPPFFVLATQNPIEQHGTYPLPVSQLDRFLFNITIDYPSTAEEFRILVLTTSTYSAGLTPIVTHEEVRDWIALAKKIHVDSQTTNYVASLVRSTRPDSTSAPPAVTRHVTWGAGPRAAQSLLAGARSMALLAGRDYATVDDVRAVALPTLRHRILLSYHATAEGVTPDRIVEGLLAPEESSA